MVSEDSLPLNFSKMDKLWITMEEELRKQLSLGFRKN
jgi:hypothetical protein